jgi:hypothetical protein
MTSRPTASRTRIPTRYITLYVIVLTARHVTPFVRNKRTKSCPRSTQKGLSDETGVLPSHILFSAFQWSALLCTRASCIRGLGPCAQYEWVLLRSINNNHNRLMATGAQKRDMNARAKKHYSSSSSSALERLKGNGPH